MLTIQKYIMVSTIRIFAPRKGSELNLHQGCRPCFSFQGRPQGGKPRLLLVTFSSLGVRVLRGCRTCRRRNDSRPARIRRRSRGRCTSRRRGLGAARSWRAPRRRCRGRSLGGRQTQMEKSALFLGSTIATFRSVDFSTLPSIYAARFWSPDSRFFTYFFH